METATFIVIALAIGLFIVIAIIRYRQLPHTPQEQFTYQAKSFDEIMKQDPKLKDFITEAKQEGALHIAHDGVITFYRNREGKYESLSLDYSPGGYWLWVSKWQLCKELPEYALTIPETI